MPGGPVRRSTTLELVVPLRFPNNMRHSMALPRRPDVLVHAEQVDGVVTALDLGQASIVGAIGLLDPVVLIVGHEIDVDAVRRKGCSGLEQMPRPRDAGLVLRLVL